MAVPHSLPVTRIPHRRWRTWWLVATVWWMVQGLVYASTYRAMADVPWPVVLRANLASSALWVPITVLAFWMAERLPLDRIHWRRHLPFAMAAAAGVVLFRAAVVVATNDWFGWYRTLPGFGEVLVTSISNNLFLFWLLLGVAHAIVFARRAHEREEQLARAELRHLKAQLHPHFLFNTLNAVNAYVRTDPEVAARMIAQLSVVLRHALQRAHAQEVSLEEELQVLAAYVEIEQLRFEDRLRVEWSIAPDVRGALVPHLLLQPLVENAIRHGIVKGGAVGTVAISAARTNGTLRLAVRDDGVGWTAPAADSNGIGLANTRLRLRQLYGDAHRLEVAAAEPRGLDVRIAIPFREATP